mgnify:CR=1 FL=1
MSHEQEKHQRAMQKLKENVDHSIASANVERGVLILLTGEGKGKSSSAFGMVMRCLGYGLQPAVVQFIKGVQLSGEELFVKAQLKDVPFYQMATGFTWDTQDRSGDIAAAERTWQVAEQHLKNDKIHLLVLDELTYMLGFKYLSEQQVINAIQQRPSQQSVVITGRGGGSALRALADTVTDMTNVKHAFDSGIAARKGVDF